MEKIKGRLMPDISFFVKYGLELAIIIYDALLSCNRRRKMLKGAKEKKYQLTGKMTNKRFKISPEWQL